jgi:hypothetical protein
MGKKTALTFADKGLKHLHQEELESNPVIEPIWHLG